MALELPLSLDDQGPLPLHRQLYGQIRGGILDGRLAAGSRLPSTRALASSLRLSRNTVAGAYDQLLAEGYLTARTGSGTFVCDTPPEELLHVGTSTEGTAAPPAAVVAPALSQWAYRALAGRVHESPYRPQANLPFDFRDGRPAVDHFPTDLWRRLITRRLRTPDLAQFGYAPSEGYPKLRELVTDYLRRARAVRCTPEQVLIVNGSQQALDLLARVCLDPGNAVVLEDPGYLGARRAFAAQGARLLPVSVDASGIMVDDLDRAVEETRPRLVYVTPSHQYPTGTVMSLPRRLALLRWARARQALVLEDDYDSEFRYSGRPVEALQGLDNSGTVVYIGTFSKVLFPSLRMGYLVLPLTLVEAVSAAKWLSDRYTATLEQQVLADFFAEGHFERHLRAMRLVYQARHDAFLEGLRRELGDLILPPEAGTGLHTLVTLQAPLPMDELVANAERVGVGIYPAAPYYLRPPERASLLMGYTGLNERAIEEGLRRLGREARRLASRGRS
jgi:GntR family transcriptional regulator/MocR family aminotransferase